MQSTLKNSIEENNRHNILYEARSLRQTRERTYLKWQSNMHPCRMKMKEAGWFAVHTTNNELVVVCLYCKKGCKGWNRDHDPYDVHRRLTPDCPFILNAHSTQTPSSPIVESIPRREQVQPSLHRMAELPERIKSFDPWTPGLPHPSFDILAEFGLFYIGQNTIVQCFSCSGQLRISQMNDDPILAHTNQCKYARHLRVHSQQRPLDIQPSIKVYELMEESTNNGTFYFLKCVSASTPGILLSAVIPHVNEQEFQDSDMNLKNLCPSKWLQQKINCVASSDGPLVNILRDLAVNAMDLTTLLEKQQCSRELCSSSLPYTTSSSSFQCRTCSTDDANPHIVSLKCRHIGLCLHECFSKWMTCAICGYTLGKTIRVYV